MIFSISLSLLFFRTNIHVALKTSKSLPIYGNFYLHTFHKRRASIKNV